MSSTLLSLFKKATVSESLFKKSDVKDLLVFWEWITLLLFCSQKTSHSFNFFCCFQHVFYCFSPFYPLLCPTTNCTRCSLKKANVSELLFKKSDMKDLLVFWEWITLLLFCSQKTSHSFNCCCCFQHVFYCFSPFYPLLCPRTNCTRRSLKKSDCERIALVALLKIATGSEVLYPSFAHKKRAIRSKNQSANS